MKPRYLTDDQIVAMIKRTDNEIKPKQIEILRIFDIWARDNRLEYFLDYGSLLGAIRDGGMIPYDDDIDVTIDVKRLNELMNNAPNYTINEDVYIKKNQWNFFFFTHKTYGKIDLFPCSFHREVLIDHPNLILKTHLKSYRPNIRILPQPLYNTKYMQFEGLNVPIPVNYDAILKLRYGDDYMTIYYANNHQYADVGYQHNDLFKNNLRKLTREEVYRLVERAERE